MHLFVAALVDNEGKPGWLEHPQYGHDMDVGALRLDNLADVEARFNAHVVPWEPEPVAGQQIWVAQDVFVVGYPFGLSSGFRLPLWIRGTIASEPAFNYVHREKALPLFLIDARSRSGQSGSPVLLYYHPGSLVPRADGTAKITGPAYSRLLGVYSGRTSNVSDLGFVWRIGEVAVLCRDGVSPDPSAWRNQLAPDPNGA
jgi:hypothetical protein